MNRLLTILLKLTLAAALLLPFGSARLSARKSEGATISLDQLLRPIQIPAKGIPVKDEKSAVAEKPEQPSHIRILEDEIMSRLAEDISSDLEEGDKLELTCKADLRPIKIPRDAEWVVYTEDRFSPDTRGNWFPLVVLEVNGEFQESWRLPLKVALFRTVHMAAYRLARGDSPKSPAIKPVVCNIYEHRGRPISATIDLSEYELVQPVAEGRFISWNDVTRRPDVRRGDTVDAVLKKGSLSISIVAQSLDNGVVGQTISLRNIRSRQEFSGVVSGTRRVEVIN